MYVDIPLLGTDEATITLRGPQHKMGEALTLVYSKVRDCVCVCVCVCVSTPPPPLFRLTVLLMKRLLLLLGCIGLLLVVEEKILKT